MWTRAKPYKSVARVRERRRLLSVAAAYSIRRCRMGDELELGPYIVALLFLPLTVREALLSGNYEGLD